MIITGFRSAFVRETLSVENIVKKKQFNLKFHSILTECNLHIICYFVIRNRQMILSRWNVFSKYSHCISTVIVLRVTYKHSHCNNTDRDTVRGKLLSAVRSIAACEHRMYLTETYDVLSTYRTTKDVTTPCKEGAYHNSNQFIRKCRHISI